MKSCTIITDSEMWHTDVCETAVKSIYVIWKSLIGSLGTAFSCHHPWFSGSPYRDFLRQCTSQGCPLSPRCRLLWLHCFRYGLRTLPSDTSRSCAFEKALPICWIQMRVSPISLTNMDFAGRAITVRAFINTMGCLRCSIRRGRFDEFLVDKRRGSVIFCKRQINHGQWMKEMWGCIIFLPDN